MSTAATPLAAASAAPHISELQKIEQTVKKDFIHIRDFVKQNYQVVLADVIQYTPKPNFWPQRCFPESAGVDGKVGDKAIQVANLLKTTVLTVEQKYSDATASDTTNEQKLGDALAIAGPASLSLLKDAGVNADTSRISNAISAVASILKTSPAPASA